jgi:malate/lactate dehydrogenase
VISWGNHAESQVPDISNTEADTGDGVIRVVDKIDVGFRHGEFVEKIRQRAWVVQRARGNTSALSAANAIVDHWRSWLYGTDEGDYVSMGLVVPENGPYGIKPGIVFSFPVTVGKDGKVEIVTGLTIDEWTQQGLNATEADIVEERKDAFAVLGIPQ